MSSTSPSRVLVTRTFVTDKYCPTFGEVMVIPLSQPLFRPGSLGSGHDHTTRHHVHVVVLWASLNDFCDDVVDLIVLPMPDYSAIDPISGLSSTEWLLSQPTDYQQVHIPVPYEQMSSVTSPNPPFPTPKQFGSPIELDGWKDTVPRWIQAVPMLTQVTLTEKFMPYDPPVNLSEDDLQRLKVYGGLPCRPNLSTSSFDPGGRRGVPEASSYCGAALGAGSSALRGLYATFGVRGGFAELLRHEQVPLIGCSVLRDPFDEDDSSSLTIVRWPGAGNSHVVQLIQDYEDEMRERLEKEKGFVGVGTA